MTFRLKTDARWRKAIQHLRESGQISESPKDIGLLIKEIQSDILKEEEQFIRDELFKHFWPHLSRGVVAGFPEFYKRTLAESVTLPNQI